MSDTPRTANQDPGAAAICRALGLPDDFLLRLLEEDDWSFLIKAHAFIEAALTHLLATALRSEALADSIAFLDTSGGRASKLAFAETLDLLPRSGVLFVEQFSELRNLVVHNVRNVSFNLADWYSSRDSNQQKSFLKRMTYFRAVIPGVNPIPDAEALDDARRLCSVSPKYALWFNLQMFALSLHIRGQSEQARAKFETLAGALIASALARKGSA